MVLESTMICVDDSHYMTHLGSNTNTDDLSLLTSTRLAQERDAVSLIITAKIQSNPENNVGIFSLVGSEFLCKLTNDQGKLMSTIEQLSVQSLPKGNIISGLYAEHYALAQKHRHEKNIRMRIIVFVGSPLEDTNELDFIRLAKHLKKEKVIVDIISFGESRLNEMSLQNFVKVMKGKNGSDGTASNLIVVPPGVNLADAVRKSPILPTEDGEAILGRATNNLGILSNSDLEQFREDADIGSKNPENSQSFSSTAKEEQIACALQTEHDISESDAGKTKTELSEQSKEVLEVNITINEDVVVDETEVSLQDPAAN